MGATEQSISTTEIKPIGGTEFLDLKELWQYRDLFFFLVWRDIKVLYAQTVLGFSWAILNPLIQILVFNIIFGRVAKLDSDGMPYILFSTVAVIPWTYMSESMRAGSQSLVVGQNMLGKVYFPRVIFPMTPVLAKLVDFAISSVLLIGVLIYYRVAPTSNLLLLPVLILAMISVPAGISMWLAALAIRFRRWRLKFKGVNLIPVLLSKSSLKESLSLAVASGTISNPGK